MSEMTLKEFQVHAVRTVAPLDHVTGLAVGALGLTGEAGEFADLIKKHLGHGHPLDYEAAIRELGDVLWYVATCSARLGVSLEEVAKVNVEKLQARYPDGFSSERSMRRSEP